MNTADRLVAARFEAWRELEDLLERARGRGIRRLSRREVERLGHLYRRTVSDLARARRDFEGDRVTEYLEGLATRAHPSVFRGQARRFGDVARFLGVEFPRAVRSLRAELWVAVVAFFGVGVATIGWALWWPQEAEPHVSALMMDRITEVGGAVRAHGVSPWVEIPPIARPSESFDIAFHNIKVTLLAFAGGALLGLFTLHVLVTNAIALGLATAFCIREDAIVPLGTFVAAHGFIELTVMTLAGAAGLSIGRAWLDPGERTRRAALVHAARRAVTVALGGAAWLLIAGLLEGMVSPSSISPWIKLTIGLSTGVTMWTFLALSGRSEDTVPEQSPSTMTS